jgi:hypothetical protein
MPSVQDIVPPAGTPAVSGEDDSGGPSPLLTRSVVAKILMAIIVVPSLVAALFIIASTIIQDKAKHTALFREAERTQALLRFELDSGANSLTAAMGDLAANPSLLNAMAGGDSALMRRAVRPMFNRLRDAYGVGYLTISKADRSPILRLEGDERAGQVVDRLNLFDAAEAGAQPFGLDLDSFGRVTLRVVAPWRDNDGHLIGFIELGRDVEPLIDAIHRVLGVDILVLVHKDLLDRDRWEEGERLAGRQRSWDELASSVAVVQTLQTVPMAVGLMIEDGSRSREVKVGLEEGRHTFAFTTRPLVDIGRREIGQIVILRDVTDANWEFQRTFLALAILAVAIIVLGFLRCRMLLMPPPPPPENGAADEAAGDA